MRPPYVHCRAAISLDMGRGEDVWWERDIEGIMEEIWKRRMDDSREFAQTGMRGKKGVMMDSSLSL